MLGNRIVHSCILSKIEYGASIICLYGMSERCRLRQASNDSLLQLLFNIVPFERNIAFDVPECYGVLIINPSLKSLRAVVFAEDYAY